MNPYVPLTVEEVNLITVLSDSADTRVRIFGELRHCPDNHPEFRILKSLGEDIVSGVRVDLR